jgi:5S rRNA maturation endonuclease (ribonuclease M5)
VPKGRIVIWTMQAALTLGAVAGMVAGTGVAADNTQKLAAGTTATKQLLLLMDTDNNGKVSKQEFMSFMEAEFDKLDVNHDGELDVKELTQLQVRPASGFHR